MSKDLCKKVMYKMKKKMIFAALIAVTFLSGTILGSCGDNASEIKAGGQYNCAEMECINQCSTINEYRDSQTGVHYFMYTSEGGISVRYNADGSVFVD